jgi:hypothetical protein
MTAPVASGWSVGRVGLAPTGKRRLTTAHTQIGHSSSLARTSAIESQTVVRLPRSVRQLIASSDHPGVPHLTTKVHAEIASVNESLNPKFMSFFSLHLILS